MISENSKGHLNQSTKYKDQHLIKAETEEQRLDWLSSKLNLEVSLFRNDVLEMEQLSERYYADAEAAKADNKLAYHMRYTEAYERISRIINSRYAPYNPVTKDGKQNVGE